MNEDQVQAVEELGGDPLLRFFASMAQRGIVEMTITLTVGGATVAGLLIGRDKWLAELTATAAEVNEAAGTFMGSIGEGIRQAQADVSAESDDPDEDTTFYGFIHLSDARYISGGRAIPSDGPGRLWRGRISEVSSWSLGTFG